MTNNFYKNNLKFDSVGTNNPLLTQWRNITNLAVWEHLFKFAIV